MSFARPVGRTRRFAAACLFVAGLVATSSCAKKVPEKGGGDGTQPAVAAPSLQPQSKPNSAPAKCEPGADGACEVSSTCSASCQRISTPECVACEAAGDCKVFVDNCTDPRLSAAEQATCHDIMSCVQTSNCFDGSSTTLGSCYCGTLKLKECLAAPMEGPKAPNGVCRHLILKGMPNAKQQSHVLGNLTTRAHAAGLSLSRLNCQKIGNKQLCADVCGFAPGSPAFPVANN